MNNYIEIKMPALSPTMTKGKLLEWKKNLGDKIKAGDVLFEIETDKAVMEYESSEQGFLAQIIINNNTDDVDVGSLVAILTQNKDQKIEIENISSNSTVKSEKINEKTIDELKQIKENENISNNINKNNIEEQNFERIKASPIAKRIANENNIDLKNLNGSGPMGRIIKSDVLNELKNHENNNNANKSIPETKENERVPMTQMRKIIAQRLLESKITIPHFYLTIDVCMDNLLNLRNKINGGYLDLGEKIKITINDFFIKIVACAMKFHPEINVSFDNDSIIKYSSIDISVAVGIDNGLITPIIFNADKLSISDISLNSKQLIEKAKANRLKQSEYQGGSITISNLGMLNIDEFKAIINPPQSSILAIGGVKKTPVVINENEIAIRQITKLSLSCDHRVVDGMVAAIFLNKIKYFVENPEMIFS